MIESLVAVGVVYDKVLEIVEGEGVLEEESRPVG